MTAPSPSTGTTETVLDTRVMPLLHTFFRREIRLAGGVVRKVAAGDRRRAGIVGDHVAFVMRALHHHHTIEDELLWPPLLRRVSQDMTPLVHLMQAQHERVDALVQQIDEQLLSFRTQEDPAVRDRLADLLDELHLHLVEHLDAEETRLLPLAARTLTQAEWDAMGEAGRRSATRKELTLAFGMYEYEGDPEVIAMMLAEAPPPVRWIVPRLSRRAFRRHALRVHGTETP